MEILERSDTTQRLARLHDYIRKDKPKVLRKDFAFTAPLQHGWMLRYLLGLDDLTWQRWAHWCEIRSAEKLTDAPIPRIHWAGEHGEGSPGWRMLDKSLCAVVRYGEWQGWSSWNYFDYFLDWLLFGLGHISTPNEPKPPGDCEGASERLYQIFNLEPLIAYPHDYFGDIMSSNRYGRQSGFFPTPMEVASMMVQMQMGEEDCRTKTVSDPCVGTGRMILCASNYSYRLYGQDINRTVIKACLVNGYLYAPWLVKPFAFLDTYESAAPDAPAIPHLTTKEQPIGQLEMALA